MKGIMVFYDNEKQEIDKISLLKAPFKRNILNKKSEEMFGEPEPCIIQETTCRNTLGMELLKYLEMIELDEDSKIISTKEINEFSAQMLFPTTAKYYSFE